MTRIFKQVLLAMALFITCTAHTHQAAAQDDAYVSYNDFYQDLAPYGQWIQDPQYGYVWSPNVDGGFRPYYSNGNWVMTDYGNTWVSNYSWGWACFHYGRWTYDAYYGWLWIPGQDWGPAWVSWRYGEGNYGWAPLGPGYEFGAAYGDYNCPSDWWVFIPPQYLYSGGYYRYWYGPRGNTEIINNTRVVNNTYVNNNITYVSGPRRAEVEQITHQPVQVYKLASSNSLNTRVHNNTVKMFRPAQVRQAAPNTSGERVAPPNVISATQPIAARPQPVNGTNGGTPAFKSAGPRSTRPADGVGANPVEAQHPAAAPQRADTHPYQWDVNRPIAQPQTHDVPEYHGQQPSAAPQQQMSRPEPQQQISRPEPQQQRPQPMPQMQRSAPAPQMSAPRMQGGGGARR
jgi:hypothetical protein